MEIITVNCGACSYDVESRDLAKLIVKMGKRLMIDCATESLVICSAEDEAPVSGHNQTLDMETVDRQSMLLRKYATGEPIRVVSGDTQDFVEFEENLLSLHMMRDHREELRSRIDACVRDNRRLHSEMAECIESDLPGSNSRCDELEETIRRNKAFMERLQRTLATAIYG